MGEEREALGELEVGMAAAVARAAAARATVVVERPAAQTVALEGLGEATTCA